MNSLFFQRSVGMTLAHSVVYHHSKARSLQLAYSFIEETCALGPRQLISFRCENKDQESTIIRGPSHFEIDMEMFDTAALQEWNLIVKHLYDVATADRCIKRLYMASPPASSLPKFILCKNCEAMPNILTKVIEAHLATPPSEQTFTFLLQTSFYSGLSFRIRELCVLRQNTGNQMYPKNPKIVQPSCVIALLDLCRKLTRRWRESSIESADVHALRNVMHRVIASRLGIGSVYATFLRLVVHSKAHIEAHELLRHMDRCLDRLYNYTQSRKSNVYAVFHLESLGYELIDMMAS